MGFQYVVFLPFQLSFHTIFLNNVGRGKSLGIATCLKTLCLG